MSYAKALEKAANQSKEHEPKSIVGNAALGAGVGAGGYMAGAIGHNALRAFKSSDPERFSEIVQERLDRPKNMRLANRRLLGSAALGAGLAGGAAYGINRLRSKD